MFLDTKRSLDHRNRPLPSDHLAEVWVVWDNPKLTLDRSPALLRIPVFFAPCISTSKKPPIDVIYQT
jgi:hypothetical protein